jgi:hypothetical protein
MDEKILAMYGLCTDVLQAIGHTDNPQDKMSDAEVITTGLVAMMFLRGNFEAARALLSMPPYMGVWSKNSNVPFSQNLCPHHHSLFILHSTARWPILTTNEG